MQMYNLAGAKNALGMGLVWKNEWQTERVVGRPGGKFLNCHAETEG